MHNTNTKDRTYHSLRGTSLGDTMAHEALLQKVRRIAVDLLNDLHQQLALNEESSGFRVAVSETKQLGHLASDKDLLAPQRATQP